MKFSVHAIVVLVTLLAVVDQSTLVAGKKPSRPSGGGRRGSSRSGPPRSAGRPSVSKRKLDDFDDEEDDFGLPDDLEDEIDEFDSAEEEEEDDDPPPSRRRPQPSSSRSAKSPRKRPSPKSRYDDDFEDDYDRPRRPPSGRGPPPRRPPSSGKRGGRGPGGRVVPFSRQPEPSTFARGLEKIRSSMPDPGAVREAAVNSLGAAREATSSLSSNLYREVKGLTSSELEQVMLKATRPDDTAVKGKHVERLVSVTYQISPRYDIYDAVLRKLWAKMAEKDWRTSIKALYILHRFSADGAPEHAPALKARLRELRRTRDPKRKDKYFNSKQMLAGDNKPESAPFRAFMSRYAHYVLIRAQCFGGMFDEISAKPDDGKDKKKKTVPKPITSTALRTENLDAAGLLLKSGLACQLKEGEACENTAIAVERVASDMIGLTAAVAMALNRALKDDDLNGADPVLIKKWCEFYMDELLPKTRAMVKKTTPKLDAYGLFLPSRMGATVSQELLQKGLKLDGEESAGVEGEAEEKEEVEETKEEAVEGSEEEVAAEKQPEEEEEKEQEAFDEEEEDEYDEYEYDDEDIYDDEEPF